MKNAQSLLAQHLFFKDLDPAYLESLGSHSRILSYSPGQFIFRQGEVANHVYLIAEGKVAVEFFSSEGGPLVLLDLGQDELLGWSLLVPPYRWRFDARTVENTVLIEITAASLLEEMEKNHDFGYEVFKRFLVAVSRRLDAALLRILDIYAAHS